MPHINVSSITEATPPPTSPQSQSDSFSVTSGPDRKNMNFVSSICVEPQPTESDVDLPCGKLRLALMLLNDYFYSRFNTQLICMNAHVVGISSDDGSKLLPEQASWEEILKQGQVRMAYDITKHTGTLFLQAATTAQNLSNIHYALQPQRGRSAFLISILNQHPLIRAQSLHSTLDLQHRHCLIKIPRRNLTSRKYLLSISHSRRQNSQQTRLYLRIAEQ